jgi:type I restriction enzyme S subunit
MTDWKLARLADLAEIKHGFAFQGEFFSTDGPGDILLTPGNFAIGGGFQWGKRKYYRGPVSNEYVLGAGDLIVTMTDLSKEADTLGYPAFVPDANQRFLHNQRIGKVLLRNSSIDLRFLYWIMCTRDYRNEVIASVTGSTVKHTSPTKILAYQFRLPPLCEQQAIASVLGALNDKIDLNRRMNQALEAMARAIFRDWFVDFGPTRAKMEGRASYLAPELWALFPERLDEEDTPKGWAFAELGSVAAELRRGISPAYIELGGVRVLNQKCVRSRWIDFGPSRRHDQVKRGVDGRELKVGDILVNSTGVGTLGRTAQIWEVDEPTTVDSHVTVVRANVSRVNACYLGLNLTGREVEIEALGEGSTGQTELARTRLAGLPTLVPPAPIQASFERTIQPLIDRMTSNARENRTLAATRELLLPKLMSGEIRVRDAEKELESVA